MSTNSNDIICPNSLTINTSRLVLRAFEVKDYDNAYSNYFSCYMQITSRAKARKACADYHKRALSSESYFWAIVLDDRIIGVIGTNNVDRQAKSCEIQYAISNHYWNKGYTSEAATAVVQFLLTKCNVNRVSAGHDVDNISSGRVLQKAGMKKVGTMREFFCKNDAFSDMDIYDIILKDII